jgi:hypothetical protein
MMRPTKLVISLLTMTLPGAGFAPGAVKPMLSERQLTDGPFQKDLDDNVNFSPDGRFLVFDCRGEHGINGNDRLGKVDVRTGKVTIFYTQKPPVLGVGAASFLNDTEVLAIHALTTGLKYDFTVRGGMIIAADGSGRMRWLDSRDITPPFTPGALRGGTHKHEPDASGEWIGFTYNDHVMKFERGSDLRNVGVSRRGIRVPVHPDPQGRNFEGESFSVLLTACVDHPKPGSDEYQRAEGDCWVGREGYPKAGGGHQRARAFRGLVAVEENGKPAMYSEVFIVDVPEDITQTGPLGPLEGTETDYPKPPRGAVVRRLTRTAANPTPALRGVSGHLRASGDGRWIAFVGKAEREGRIENQVFVVSPTTGDIRPLSHLPGGVADSIRFSPVSRYVTAAAPDGSVWTFGAEEKAWGKAVQRAPANPHPAFNLVISPDARLIAYNRKIGGVLQIFLTEAP